MIFTRRVRAARRGTPTEIAAAWALEDRSELTPQQLADRDNWRAAHPKNDEAYRTAVGALELLDRHAAQANIFALRAAALGAQSRRSFGWRAVLAAGLAGMVLAGSFAWWIDDGPAKSSRTRYATAIGERSTIKLPDGSEMSLNTATVADVAFSPSERHVRLLKGQALFTVAPGQPAPFRVYAGDRVVTAMGTVFDVRLDGQKIQVTMVEGHVRVNESRKAAAIEPSMNDGETLSAGETMRASPDEVVTIRQENAERAVSWRSGLLTFENMPLVDAVAEVNRYTVKRISLSSSISRDYRITGTFRVGEPDRFAKTLTQLFPLDLRRTPDGRSELTERPPDAPVTKSKY